MANKRSPTKRKKTPAELGWWLARDSAGLHAYLGKPVLGKPEQCGECGHARPWFGCAKERDSANMEICDPEILKLPKLLDGQMVEITFGAVETA